MVRCRFEDRVHLEVPSGGEAYVVDDPFLYDSHEGGVKPLTVKGLYEVGKCNPKLLKLWGFGNEDAKK
jgi:hypothetical protein